MKEIILTQGKVALVDDEDFELLNSFTWQALRIPNKTIPDNWLAGHGIAKTAVAPCKTVFMHRIIMLAPVNMHVDHIDGNGLNNQRYNLRVCTVAENNRNTPKRGGTTSNYKGVYYRKDCHKWQAQIESGIRADGKRNCVFLGHYTSEVEAALAYDFAAQFYFGEFARCNFSR